MKNKDNIKPLVLSESVKNDASNWGKDESMIHVKWCGLLPSGNFVFLVSGSLNDC